MQAKKEKKKISMPHKDATVLELLDGQKQSYHHQENWSLWKLKLLKEVLKQICLLPFLKLLERYLQLLEWVSKFFWASVFEYPWIISCWQIKHVLQLVKRDFKRKFCLAVCLRKIKIKHLLNWEEVDFISIIKWQPFERLCHRNRISTTKQSPWS